MNWAIYAKCRFHNKIPLSEAHTGNNGRLLCPVIEFDKSCHKPLRRNPIDSRTNKLREMHRI